MCPNCSSEETGDFLKKQKGIEEDFKLNKCHECDCVFITFDFDNNSDSEMVVNA